jgi:hypothetical protein
VSFASIAPGDGTSTAWAQKSGMRRSRNNMPPLVCGIGAHAPIALGRQFRQFGHQPAILVEELLGPVALHPAF